MELKLIAIDFLSFNNDNDDEGDIRMHNWETLTRILPYVRHTISLSLSEEGYNAEVEEIQDLARAIHGHPMISVFDCNSEKFTSANFDSRCSALVTLPSLERVHFGLSERETEEEGVLLNLEPLKELLRAPALRFVAFEDFYFNSELCYATANALEEGSSIIDITFNNQCSFPDGGRAIIANALKINATVTDTRFFDNCDEPFGNSLAAVLLCNSTLQNLTFCRTSLAAVILCN
jgi:hypothetical protein